MAEKYRPQYLNSPDLNPSMRPVTPEDGHSELPSPGAIPNWRKKNGDYLAIYSDPRSTSPPSPLQASLDRKGAYSSIDSHTRPEHYASSFRTEDQSTSTLSSTEHVPVEKNPELVKIDMLTRNTSPTTTDTSKGSYGSKRMSNKSGRISSRSHRRERALAAALKKEQRKRRCKIIGIVFAILVAIGVGVGVALRFTVLKPQPHYGPVNVYVPPVVAHASPQNDLMVQMFEWNIPKNATHWNRIIGQLANLNILGVKKIWIPPPAKNANRANIGYDVYDLWDLGEFNQAGNVSTNMGTKPQLETLSMKIGAAGMELIVDTVLNQRSGGEAAIPCQAHTFNTSNHLQATSNSYEISAYVQFQYKARNGKYSTKTWGCDDFTGVDYDAKAQQEGLFKLEGNDNAFELDVCQENGNFDYLMLADVAYNNPSVRADVLSWVNWLHSSLNITGTRLDAGKHLSTGFMLSVMDEIKANNGGVDKFFAVEYFTDDVDEMTQYHSAMNGRVWLYDTALLTNYAGFYQGTNTDIRQVFNTTWMQNNAKSAVTLVATHDTQPGQSLDSLYVTGWFQPLAYAINLLRMDGLPCLFYGDIYGMYDATVSTFTLSPHRQIIASMAVARKYWAYGTQTDYWVDANVWGWTRTGIPGDRPDGLAVVISIANTGTSVKMNVGAQHAGETWADLTQNIIGQKVVIGSDGSANFPVRGESVSVWYNTHAAEGIPSLGQFDGDIYDLYPYFIGHATNNYQSGGTLGQGGT